MPKHNPLPYIDERLGHVAIDMGLMTKEQVEQCQLQVIRSIESDGGNLSFGESAIKSGYITSDDYAKMMAEEQRRRRLISGYEILDNLGSGTIATVYHARQLAMDREVALKILHPRLASDPVFVEAYIAEAQAVSRFHHPNIVQGYDSGESNGFYYFAHEYLSGGSMANRLESLRESGERLTENRLLLYLRQTNAALRHAWAVAVFHGDINPGNLLLDGQGNIKLANLGVPRVAKPKMDADGHAQLDFVRCGPEYAAPEQLENPGLVNAHTDMYNLGATFYHLSFGTPPFPGQHRKEILEARAVGPVPSFSLKSQEAFSSKYLRLIHDMLEPDPARRPADPEELADRLENFHIPDLDELGRMTNQGRRAAGSSAGKQISARFKGPAPASHGWNRNFSLRPNRQNLKLGRAMGWLVLMVLGVLAALAAMIFG